VKGVKKMFTVSASPFSLDPLATRNPWILDFKTDLSLFC
jgi:hypothetical protein